MSLPDFFERTAIAASQVMSGFDQERIRTRLEGVTVGIRIGSDVSKSLEGQALLDLLIRLIARLYPVVSVRQESKGEKLRDDAIALAKAINQRIEIGKEPTIEITVGKSRSKSGDVKQIFVGSNGWNAFVGTSKPLSVGKSNNPFGAGAAACLAAANLFRLVFQQSDARADSALGFSVLHGESRPGSDVALTGSFGNVPLIGAGAIGNGAAWALAKLPMEGSVSVVDHQIIDLGNLQRYILGERKDEGQVKVQVLARYFVGKARAVPYAMTLADFLESQGYVWPRMILALDSSRDRRAAQASLPQWIGNAWTQPGDLGVSSHSFLEGACVACLYLPQNALENEDQIIASTFGIGNERLKQIRDLLYNNQGVPRDLLEAVAEARLIALDRLLPFEGRKIRELYVEGFCGGAVISLGSAGVPRRDVHVPLAHQSALAGILLAASLVKQVLGLAPNGTTVTRLDVMNPLGQHLTQLAGKDPRGICICHDADYQGTYKSKYGIV